MVLFGIVGKSRILHFDLIRAKESDSHFGMLVSGVQSFFCNETECIFEIRENTGS